MAGNSESNKRGVKTRKERHGSDFYKRITSLGGRQRTRGYFGYLRDTNPQALSELSSKAGKKSAKVRMAKTTAKPKAKGRAAEENSAPVPRG